jgi:virulence-associated protein VapD
MKYFFYFVLGFIFLSNPFLAQDIGSEIHQLYKQGKYQDLNKYFADKLTVKIIQQEDFLNKSQAEAVIKNFFDKHAFVSLQNSRLSGNPEQFQYITGTLKTNNGEFRLSILVKKNQIHQYRIESHD